MTRSVKFSRCCTQCGKSLQIPISLLGKIVQCNQCGFEFVASPSNPIVTKPVDEFDLKVANLISAADVQLAAYSPPV
jgi:hypothetical protein